LLAGLSQGQVAKLLNMHRPTVSEIEAGNRRVSADELPRFAATYDVSLTWLMGESPENLEESNPRILLAARELSKLEKKDFDHLMRILTSLREADDEKREKS
jgi:transcriptional regulator with XRE-family HTH domain